MTREHIFRRGIRTNFAKHRQPAWYPRIRRARKVKSLVLRQKQTEDLSPANDGDNSFVYSESIKRGIKPGPDRVPQQRIRMRRVGRKRRDLSGQDETLTVRSARAAFVRMAAMHNDRSVIQRILKETLIGIVADRRRHLAFAVRNHPVGGNDHIAFDAVHG